ncbi:hypothetical protein KR032_000595 [Drosophila birchii]|nr:hypothetical protein KR032_000595 [Drosophila birchii]
MLNFGQQLILLALACFALQMAHSLFLPTLDELVDKKEAKLDLFGAKKQKELLKKLDFLNLFSEKKEAKLEKKEDEWEKFKQWWDEKKEKELAIFEAKKEKELAFFEAKKEKELAFLEGKLAKKTSKKSKARKTTVKPCYSYQEQPANEEEYATTEAYEEEYESEEVTEKSCQKCYKEKPTYTYELRDDEDEEEEGDVRYFT